MIDLKITVRLSALAGLFLFYVLIREAINDTVGVDTAWWAAFAVAVLLMAPEMSEVAEKLFNLWRGKNAKSK